MPEPKSQSTAGMKAIAVIVAWMCLDAMGNQLPPDDGNAIFNAFEWVTKIIGLATAVAIWTRSSWMLATYFAWYVLILIRRGWHDAQLEPELWDVVFGIAILAIFWGAVGAFLLREQRESTRPHQPPPLTS